jgi:hypothetical protein
MPATRGFRASAAGFGIAVGSRAASASLPAQSKAPVGESQDTPGATDAGLASCARIVAVLHA